MYKYVALDFDGTILGSNHKISDRTVATLKKLQTKGIVVILCSGRNISQMEFVAEQINSFDYNTYIVSDNGGVVTHLKKGNKVELKNNKFDSKQLSELFEIVKGKTRVIVAFNDGQRYLTKFNMREMLRAYIRFGEFYKIGKPVQASKVLMIDKKEKIERIYNQEKDDILTRFPELNVFRSVPTLIEVTPKDSTKGKGLSLVFEKNNWDLKDLIVFGDGENDISMFEVAGKAVAMENGFDTVKAKADDICKTNDEDGVAIYLENLYDL